MDARDEAGLSVIAPVLTAVLQSLHALEFVGRHLDPEQLADVLGTIGTPDEKLRAALTGFAPDQFSDTLAPIAQQIADAAARTLTAFDGARAAADAMDVRGAYRALRQEAGALEALYPLVPVLPAVAAFFLEPAARQDADLQARLAAAAPDTGVMHAANERDMRGGFSVFVPESYRPEIAHPVVVALHGGSGHGRTFRWNWVRTARGRGLVVVCPTAMEQTWALGGSDVDGPNIARILNFVRGRWNIDPAKMLLTGMSDGATFTLLSGLQDASPFTHLAPFAPGFHPMLVQMSSQERLAGLPVYLVHGERDWMFPVEMARRAAEMFQAVGARITYREVANLAHVYPRDENAALVDWFLREPVPQVP